MVRASGHVNSGQPVTKEDVRRAEQHAAESRARAVAAHQSASRRYCEAAAVHELVAQLHEHTVDMEHVAAHQTAAKAHREAAERDKDAAEAALERAREDSE